jgi:hypothetical protein
MKKQVQFLAKASGLVLVFIGLQSFLYKGGDYYKVLLNGKLVTEQYVYKPAALKVLSLGAVNASDRLTVYYSHCGHVGTGRTVAVKNESGKILKQWKFADSAPQETPLALTDIMQASSNQNTVSVFYASKEMPSGKALIKLNVSATAVARR